MSRETPYFYDFGPFRLDTSERVLLRAGEPVTLTPKAFQTLLVLVKNSGHVVEKDQLMREVWPDSFVEEGGLSVNIFRLRRVLGDSNEPPHYIETVPRRGYRFVAQVRESHVAPPSKEVFGDSTAPPPAHELAPSQIGNSDVVRHSDGFEVVPLESRRRLKVAIPLLALIAAGLSIALYFWLARRPTQPKSVLDVKSIAILPFKTLGGNESDQALGQGMADALITKLSNVKQVSVRPTSAVLKYDVAGAELTGVARELRVDALLDGFV